MQELATSTPRCFHAWLSGTVIAASVSLAMGCGSTAPGTGMGPATGVPTGGGVPTQAQPPSQVAGSQATPTTTTTPPTGGQSMMSGSVTPPGQNIPVAAGTGGGAGAGGKTPDASAAGGQATAPGTGCDRACLIGVMTNYLTALSKKDPSGVMFTDDVRFTENGVEHKIGEGLWKMASGIREPTRLDFADPVAGQVGSQLVVETGTSAAGVCLRLKVVDGRISEVESVVPPLGGFVPVMFDGFIPDPVFKEPIDPSKRASRDDLLKTAQGYEKLLETGSAKMAGVKFDPKMVRLENGGQTDNAAGLSTRERGSGQGDVPSRYLIIDEEYGMVFAVFEFANSLVPNELFKITDGQIRLLNIVINGQMGSGWK